VAETAVVEHNGMMPSISVVIPVYCGVNTVQQVVEGVVRILAEAGIAFEIILVDDGSPDETWSILHRIHQERPNVIKAIQLMRNFGQHNAIMCGLRHAKGDYIITMDDDGQHPPEEIPKLLRAIEQTGADVVYGVPRERSHAPWRNLGSWIVVTFYKLVFRTHVTPSAFRVMRRQVVEAILSYDLNYTYIDGLLAWNTDRIAQIEVEHRPRKLGQSGYNFAKLFTLAMNLFTNFSLLPLQIVSATGFVVALAGLVLGLYYFVQKIVGNIAVPGYASLIVAVLFLGGLQLLALGIIGEYLGRIHLNINKQPQYSIREVLMAAVAGVNTTSNSCNSSSSIDNDNRQL
jgi:undecaprenyl-phosphate 4-deoxy-4-formamido-L-arabinose transferase